MNIYEVDYGNGKPDRIEALGPAEAIYLTCGGVEPEFVSVRRIKQKRFVGFVYITNPDTCEVEAENEGEAYNKLLRQLRFKHGRFATINIERIQLSEDEDIPF